MSQIFTMRDYQIAQRSAVFAKLREHPSTLVQSATGTGKTVVFAHLVNAAKGRCMVICGRDELIDQAADKIHSIMGIAPGIERNIESVVEYDNLNAGELFGRTQSGRFKVIVGSVQTLSTKNKLGQYRFEKFDPKDFSLLIVDECHHAIARTWRSIISHFQQNPALKVVGFTATPNRHDKKAMNNVFDSVAFRYPMQQAIADGYLVRPVPLPMVCEGIDFSKVKSSKSTGDFDDRSLAQMLEYEGSGTSPLQFIARATLEPELRHKQTLVFAVNVEHAKRICEIINRIDPNSAQSIDGGTDRLVRKEIVKDYRASRFRVLVNCMVATEGFDAPNIEAVLMGRMTQSDSLYEQMIGRGTRTLPGTLDGLTTVEERLAAIAKSAKPKLIVADVVGVNDARTISSCYDILGGEYAPEVVEEAKRAAKAKGKGRLPEDISEELEEAKTRVEKRDQEQREAERRKGVVAEVRIKKGSAGGDIFDKFAIKRPRASSFTPPPLHGGALAILRKNRVNPDEHSVAEQRAIFKEIRRRMDNGLCTFPQAEILRKFGLPTNVKFDDARATIDRIAAQGWKVNPTATVRVATASKGPPPKKSMAERRSEPSLPFEPTGQGKPGAYEFNPQ
jgi:superfamily II DNA or RNA helicase